MWRNELWMRWLVDGGERRFRMYKTSKGFACSYCSLTWTATFDIYLNKRRIFLVEISGNGSPTSLYICKIFVFVRRFPFLVQWEHGILWNRSNAFLSRIRENLRKSRGQNKRQFKRSSKDNEVEWKLLRFEYKSHSFSSGCLRKFDLQRSRYGYSESPEGWILSTDFSVVCL